MGLRHTFVVENPSGASRMIIWFGLRLGEGEAAFEVEAAGNAEDRLDCLSFKVFSGDLPFDFELDTVGFDADVDVWCLYVGVTGDFFEAGELFGVDLKVDFPFDFGGLSRW